jgi:hypothetical protein
MLALSGACWVSAQAQLHVGSGEILAVTSEDELQLQENLSNSGEIHHLTLSGGAAQDITGTGTIRNLKLNKTTGTTATIQSGMQRLTGVLTPLSGTLAAGGFLTLKSTSNAATARVAGHTTTGSVTGTVYVERFIDVQGRVKKWRMLGFPYKTAVTLSTIQGMAIDVNASSPSIMYYNEGSDDGSYTAGGARNAGYQSMTDIGHQIPVGKGVMAWIYGSDNSVRANGTGTMSGSLTVTTSGTLYEDVSEVNLPVSYSDGNTNRGWNLVANPFASPILWDLSSNITRTGIGASIYRYDPQNNRWTSHNGGPSGGTNGADNIIESGGAFFVKATASTPVLTIKQDAKVGTATGFTHFGRVPQLPVQGQRVPSGVRPAGIRASVSGASDPAPDEVYVDLSRADATPGFDGAYDALTMGRSGGTGLAVKGEGETYHAMQYDRPIAEAGSEKRYYTLRVTGTATGQQTLVVRTEGAWNPLNSVSLIDTKAGRTLLLQGGSLSYAYQATTQKEEGRFLLAVNHVKVDRETGLPAAEMKLLGNPVQGEMLDLLLTHPTAQPRQWSVVDMTGRTVATGRFNENASDVQHRLPVPGLRTTGSYVLQVELDNGERRQLRFLKP